MAYSVTVNAVEVGSMFLTNGNFTTTSNTLVDVPDLAFPLKANSRYSVVGAIHAGCDNTGGYKLGGSLPSGSTAHFTMQGSTTNATTYINNPEFAAGSPSATFCTENNANRGIWIGGTITTGSVAGNWQVKVLAVTSTQTATIYQAGTVLTITKIA